jgi:O-antigen ligase
VKDRFLAGISDPGDRKLAMFELGVAFVCGAIWFRWPQAGWLPLLVALIPWVIRLPGDHFTFKRTAFDIPIAIFLASALVGVWAAYNREAAWAKFWWIVSAILLYFALARQPRANVWPVVALIAISCILLAGYFLLTYNWADQPVEIGFVNRIARVWMSFRPGLPFSSPDSAVTAEILAILAPLPLALGIHGWRKGRWNSWRPLLLAGLASLTILWALFLTAERLLWLSLIAAGVLWLGWEFSVPLGRSIRRQPQAVFGVGLAAAVLLGLALVIANPGGVKSLSDRLPGPDEATSRTTLWSNALKLVGDYPVTGAGLQAFPGEYSQYILVIPFYFVDNSHNLYLEVSIEQGILAFIALVVILVGCYKILIFGKAEGGESIEMDTFFTLRGALLAGLTVLVLYGLLENAFYAGRDVWFLFLLPGLVIATTQTKTNQVRPVTDSRRRQAILVGGVAIILLVLVGFWRPLLASWYADLGAVEMARTELAHFPVGKWEDPAGMSALAPAESQFQKALQLNPRDRTSLHRLGLIAMRQGDYISAVDQLERAFTLDPAARGIRKELGYSYAWTGQIDQAVNILEGIREARSEMDVYSRWWIEHGRPDLAENARRVWDRLS